MRNDALELLYRMIGLPVICRDEQRVGRVDDIFFSPRTSRAEWIAVRRSQLSRHVTPIPLAQSTVETTDVRTSYTSVDIHDAPTYPAHESLTVLDEKRLQDYWSERRHDPTSSR